MHGCIKSHTQQKVVLKRFQNPEFRVLVEEMFSSPNIAEYNFPDFFTIDKMFIVTNGTNVEMEITAIEDVTAKGTVKDWVIVRGILVVFKDGSEEILPLNEINASPWNHVDIEFTIQF